MRLRNWLFAGTSMTLISMAPPVSFAQDAPAALPQVCIDQGFTTLEECIAAQPAGAAPPAAEEAAPAPEAPAEEAAPPAEEPAPAPEEAAPAPEPQPEPAPEAAPAEPEPQPEAAPAERAPEPEAAPEAPAAEEPAPEPEARTMETEAQPEAALEEPAPEPAQRQAAPEAEQAPEAQPEATPEPAAQPEAAPVEAAPVEAAPAEPAPEEAAPAPANEAASSDIASALAAQVDIYNTAVAEISAGGDAAAAQVRIDAALAEINSLCANAGMPDVDSCLAPLGLTLNPVPDVQDVTPAAPAERQPADQTAPADGTVDPNAPATRDAPVTSDGQPAEIVEDLPEGVTQDQIAPALDSAKEMSLSPDGQAPVEPAADANGDVNASARMAVPENDEAAQSEEMRTFAADSSAMSATAEEGTQVTATDNSTVNQTVVNNYITNITNITNNNNSGTTINNNTTVVDNSQTNIGQQNNITVVEQVPVREASAGDLVTQVILQVGSQLIVNSIGQDTDRFYDPQQDEVYYENLPNGRVREVVSRPDGSQVVTVRNRNGDILRRSRIMPDGREIVLASFDDRYDDQLLSWRDPGLDLPPLRLNIPVREYVLDAAYADENEVTTFFRQPPVEQVQRLYSIDEVKRSARVRDSVRRLEVGNLTFDTGAATIDRDQVTSLSSVAKAMLDLLASNPAETFLIEGHTDAVGSDISNLRLSDLRAATVARILTDFYGVPPENLATQGYGERYLKIRTEAADRENRRVTIRRITPLVTVASN